MLPTHPLKHILLNLMGNPEIEWASFPVKSHDLTVPNRSWL